MQAMHPKGKQGGGAVPMAFTDEDANLAGEAGAGATPPAEE